MFVTDTHPLLWYINGDNSKLSDRIRDIFAKTKTAETLVYIPAVVFLEIAILEKLGRVRLARRFDQWAEDVLSLDGIELSPLTIDQIHRATGYGVHRDPFDNIIVAAAAELDLPLITKDVAITESNLVQVCW